MDNMRISYGKKKELFRIIKHCNNLQLNMRISLVCRNDII